MRGIEFDELVNTGGHRISNNDIFQLKVALEQLGQVFGESFGLIGAGGRVLAGVKETTTATDISYSGGWLFRQGVFWKVNPMAAQTLAAGHSIYFVYKVTRNFAPVHYQSGAIFQPHIEREVDILYTTSSNPIISTGINGVDFTIPFYVRFERIEDLIREMNANTSQREQVESSWVELTAPEISSLVLGSYTVGVGSMFRYKTIGKQLFLNISVILPSTAPLAFTVNLPNGINLRNSTQPSILAFDSIDVTKPCAVHFAPGVTQPSVMNFARTHSNTALASISFSTILELA